MTRFVKIEKKNQQFVKISFKTDDEIIKLPNVGKTEYYSTQNNKTIQYQTIRLRLGQIKGSEKNL